MITRYDDAIRLLKETRLTVDFKQILPPEVAEKLIPPIPELKLLGNNMLTKDGADHIRLRLLVQKAFTPQMVTKLRPRIQEIANSIPKMT
ncbi:hypothetical protein JNUCC42_00275 [Brevibacterium sp. JNUCC-42]|nr:hypothetical protein JNUCC42_00275 [Brevibacterium sp. JNUCC-42]